MADKYWWEKDDQKTEDQGYWWDKMSVATEVGNNITNRVNTWLKNHDNYVSNYQNRYAGRKYNYEDSYVKDSGSWMATVSKQADAFEAERQSILSYMDHYKGYLDEEWMKSVRDTLESGSNAQKQIRDIATQDNEWWNGFGSDQDLVGKYGSAEGVYNYFQRADGYTKKYNGMTDDDIQNALSVLDDGEEKTWLDSYQWRRYLSESDFDKYANAGAAIKNPTMTEAESDGRFLWWEWDGADIGNIVTYSRENADMLAMAGANNENTKGNYVYRSMEDDEVKLYNYLLAKYGEEKGAAFLSYLMDDLHRREGGAMANRLRGIDIPVVEEAAIGAFGLMAGVDQWASGTRQLLTNEVQPTTVEQYANSDIANSLDGFGKYAYQATNVVGNMLPSIALSKGLGALGAGVKTARLVGATTMSLSAAGNAYADGISEYGMEPWQARTYGTLVGIAEGALEYALGGIPAISKGDSFIDAKIKMIDNGLLRIGAKLGWDVVEEIREEELQNFLEPLFRSFFTGEYDAPTFEELLETAIVTAISTPIMGGGDTIVDDIHGAKNALKKYGNKTDALIQEGLQNDVNTESYKLAQKYQQQVQGKDGKGGKAMTGNQIRNLLAANQEQVTANDIQKIQKAAENRLVQKGQKENVTKLAELATKYVTGQELSRSEKSFLASSKMGAQVTSEMLNAMRGASSDKLLSKWENDMSEGWDDNYSTEWAENIETKGVYGEAQANRRIRALLDAVVEDPATYKSLTERVGDEGRFGVSESEQAIIRATNAVFDFDSAKVVEVGDGQMSFEREDGGKLSAGGIDFADANQSFLVSAVSNIENITPAAATSIMHEVVDMSKPLGEQLNGIDEAFTYGYHGYSEADLKAGEFGKNLTEEQRMRVYELGKEARKNSRDSKVDSYKRMRTAVQAETEKAAAEGKAAPKSKNLTITYNHGGGVIEDIATAEKKLGKLNPEQRAGIEAAKILHQMGIGTDFELFTSYYSKTLKDKDGNPLEVFINDEGQEQAAYAGVYMAANGKIRINLNAYSGTKGLTLNALSHELTHFIKTWSLDKYTAMAEFLVKAYGEHGVSMHKLVLKEQDRLEKIRGKEVSYDEAYDEVVANAFNRMLEDGKVMERIAEIRQVDKSLADKIIDGIRKFIKRFFKFYENNHSLFKETEALMEMKEVFEQLQAMFAEALVEASDNFQASLIAKEAGLEVMSVEDTTQFSYQSLAEAAGFNAVENEDGTRSFTRDGKKVSEVTVEDIDNSPIGAFINFSVEMKDISDADAKRQKEMFAKICTMACQTNDFAMTMQFVGSAVFTGMKANADKQYGTTYDFPSICTKTQAVIDAMSAKMMSLGRGLTTDEIVKLYDDVFASGNPVPCPECYVFSRWIGIGGLLDNIKKYQDYYGDMAVEDVAAEYRKMKAEVSKFADEQGISFGKAKGALTSKLTKEFNKLTEKVEKAQNQGEKVKPADLKRLEELEPMMNTVKGMTWLENVYFADSSLKKVNPKFRVPDSVLFDLNNGEAFATQYKEAWAFRTTQGAGYGKAITPYAEARLGEGVLVTNNTTNAIKGRAQGTLNNYFLNQKGKLDKQSRDALKKARLKQKIQAFLGGQRFQSTSDARYENASDYLLAALEMQAMGGMVQCYTKVDGAVPAFSAWGFSINQSLMPLNGGLDADGNVKDTAVGGMKPSVAFENRNKHESAGTITIGVNDNHIRAMFKQWVRDFIIPYHASGGKADVVAEFRRIQEGKEAKGEAVRSTDYSRTQGDKVLSDEVLRWQGKTDAQIQRIHEIRNARIAILTGGKPNMTVVRSNRFLSALYDKFDKGGEWEGVKVAKSKVESQIFPNEFWDQTVTYDESAKIVKDYLEYCEDLGFLHRFSGMIPSNGRLVPAKGYDQNGNRVQLTDLAYKYDENGNKTAEVEEFFWKVLTDRRMYDNNGNYLPQKKVTLNDTTTETVTDFAKNNQGRQYDKAKAEALAKKIAKGEQYSSQETDRQQYNGFREKFAKVRLDSLSDMLGDLFPLSAGFEQAIQNDKTPVSNMTIVANSMNRGRDDFYKAAKEAFKNLYGTRPTFSIKQLGITAYADDNFMGESLSKEGHNREKQTLLDLIPAYKQLIEDSRLLGVERLIHNDTKAKKESLLCYRLYNAYIREETYVDANGSVQTHKVPHIVVFSVIQNLADAKAHMVTDIKDVAIRNGPNSSRLHAVHANGNISIGNIADVYGVVKSIDRKKGGLLYSAGQLAYKFDYSQKENGELYSSQETDIDTSGMDENAKEVIHNLKIRAMGSRYRKGVYASYSAERIERELRASSATKMDYAKSYIAWVEPLDFLYATTISQDNRAQIEKEAGELDLERLRKQTQPIHLTVDFETGKIVGHEGRHRMIALYKAGVEKVAVIFDAWNDDRYNTKPVDMMRIGGQDFDKYHGGIDFYAHDMLPLSKRYADAAKKLFSEVDGSLRFSTQQTDNITNRDMLANAFEWVVQNSKEYEMLQEYRENIGKLNELDAKLSELNSEIREIRFTKGKYDAEKLHALETEAEGVVKEINKQDKKLLQMEASEPLRKVIEQERKKEAEKTKAHVKQIIQNKKARAEQTELRHKIRKAVRDLDKLLNRGNKKLNVKEDMKDFVSKTLELADYLFTDHISNDELIRRGITVRMTPREAALVKETEDIIAKLDAATDINQPNNSLTNEEFTRLDATRKANEEKLRDLLTAQRNERLSTPVSKLFDDLVKAYASLKNSSQDAVKAAYNEELENSLRAFMSDDAKLKILENMRVADMTTEELNWLYRAYTMVLNNVRNANKFHVKSKMESIDKMAEAIVWDFGSRKIPDGKAAIVARNLANKMGWDYEKLYYALDRIGSEAFTELFMNLANSENIVMQDVMEAMLFRDQMVEKYKFNTWKVNKEIDREFLDTTGKKFKLTLGQLMSLYAYSRREGAWDHIEYGGFVFGEKALTNPRPADSYKLSKEQCEAITSLLTKEQKGYVEDMQKFLSETMGEKGNEVSMMLYGIKMFGEKNYFPIHVAGQFKAQAQESQAKAAAGFGSMSNAGFTHAQNPNAKAPFVLEGFNEVWTDHVNEMSRYHGTVPALEDIRRVMNRSSYSDAYLESMSVKAVMENAFGKDAVDYFDNLYREANSGAITDKLQRVPKKLLSLFRKNSVAYKLSVLVQQPTSIIRAYAMIDKKYFGLKGFGAITSGVVKAAADKFNWTKAHTNAYNEMLKYAPGVTMAKEIGGFDTATGGSIRSTLLDTGKSLKQKWDTGTALEKGKAVLDFVDNNAIANLPNVADKIAWIEIWNACKRETVAKHKDLTPNSEEFMQAVGDRFTEVIRATQVYDSIFAKSPMLKSKNPAVQYLVSFMNEPNTVANMAESAVRDAVRGDWKGGVKKAVVLVYAALAVGLVKSLVYAMHDDDEDETYAEKYIEALVGSLVSDFNPLSYIPIARDVSSALQGYDIERPDVAIIVDVIEALQATYNNANKDTENLTEAQLAELEEKKDEAAWKVVGSVAAFLGIPVKNIRKDVMGIYNTVFNKSEMDTTMLSLTHAFDAALNDSKYFFLRDESKSKQDKLYEALVAGDTAYVNRLKAGYKDKYGNFDQSKYDSAVRTVLRENDPRIHEAALARYEGRIQDCKRIYQEIKKEGKFNPNDILEAIYSEEAKIRNKLEPKTESSDYSSTDFMNAILVGESNMAQAMKDDIIAAKVANGMTQEQAEDAFESSIATATRNAFDSGLLDEAGTEKMLQEYAGMDEEETAETISYWAFQKAHPDAKDLSKSNVEDYLEFAEPAGISLDIFQQFVNGTSGLSTIYDEWGDVEKSKRDQVLEVIDSLPLTWQQKDALYLACGYAESKIWDVPW